MSTISRSDIIAQFNRLGRPLPPELANPVKPRPTPVGNGDILALSIKLQLRTVSEANTRRGARSKMVRTKALRNMVRTTLAKLSPVLPPLPARITLIRHGARKLDIANLWSAVKAPQDGIADVYGVDDGSDQYTWDVAQVKSKTYAVEIRIERRE